MRIRSCDIRECDGSPSAPARGAAVRSGNGTLGGIVLWTLLALLGAELLSGAMGVPIRGHPFFPDAIAKLWPASGSAVSGSVAFVAEAGGVRVSADVAGLPPGQHGFHVHERGDCSASDASSAGGHFDPIGMPHAGPDAAVRHVGDLGNLTAGRTGQARLLRFDRLIALRGPASVVGRAVIIHERRDDLVTQPSGNAGARLACGVIQAVASAGPRRAKTDDPGSPGDAWP